MDGLPHRTQGGSHHPSPFTSPCPSPKPTTTIGRFQVFPVSCLGFFSETSEGFLFCRYHTNCVPPLVVLPLIYSVFSSNVLLIQVTTNPEARVGRFSVSRAPEQSLEPRPTPPPAAQAANGPCDQMLSPDPTHKASLPSLNNNSFNNSYISSDNDSEFEDEDFKREVSRLREKQVIPSSLLKKQREKAALLPCRCLLLWRLTALKQTRICSCFLFPLCPKNSRLYSASLFFSSCFLFLNVEVKTSFPTSYAFLEKGGLELSQELIITPPLSSIPHP